MLRRVNKYLLHLRGVPPGEFALQGGALETQPQRALLCRGARQALTTLRTTVAHEALSRYICRLCSPSQASPSHLAMAEMGGAMLVHRADTHRPVDTEMPTTLHAVKVRPQAHHERQPCEASEAPQTAEVLPRDWKATDWALQGSCCVECTRAKA